MSKYIRVTNPTGSELDQIANSLQIEEIVVVQFSQGPYDPQVLCRIEQLCSTFDARFTVRFYGHYAAPFDARVLLQIPSVKSLSVDCLSSISNFESLMQLENLERLAVGVFRFDQREFLSWRNLHRLRYLCLGDSSKDSINLESLVNFSELEELLISGQNKGIQVVGTLAKLKSLMLSTSYKGGLQFLNGLRRLCKLRFILGGRSDLAGLETTSVEELEILRVRGFEADNFLLGVPNLRTLRIEDQIRLNRVNFPDCVDSLVDVSIINCKGLTEICGLMGLKSLQRLLLSGTAIDPEAILAGELPPTLRELHVHTGKPSIDRNTEKRISSKGLVVWGGRQ
jgi:hypothetical protein